MPQSKVHPRTKLDRRVKRTQKFLTQALTQLLKEKQIHQISVRELTELADLNRGTFYRYYKDVFEMLEKMEEDLQTELKEIIARHENDDMSQRMKLLLSDLLRFIKENQEICGALLCDKADLNFLHKLNETVRESCLKISPHKKDDPVTFEYRYSFLAYGCAGIIRTWLGGGCQESVEKMVELLETVIP